MAAQRWARALGLDAEIAGGVALVRPGTAGQTLRFASVEDGRAEGITELWLTPGLPGLPNGDQRKRMRLQRTPMRRAGP